MNSSRVKDPSNIGAIKLKKVVAVGYWPDCYKLDWAKVGVFKVTGIDKSIHGNRYMYDSEIAAKGCINGNVLSIVTRDMWKF